MGDVQDLSGNPLDAITDEPVDNQSALAVASPTSVGLTLTVPTPSVRLAAYPSAIPLALSVLSPTVRLAAKPSAVGLSLAVPTPSIQTTYPAATPGSVGLSLSVPSPSVRLVAKPSPIVLSLAVPAVEIVPANPAATPSAVGLSLFVPTPTVRLVARPGSVGLSLFVPAVTIPDAPAPLLHVHDADHNGIPSGSTYTLSGLEAEVATSFSFTTHNHGDADLTITAVTISDVVNATVTLISGPNLPYTVAAGDLAPAYSVYSVTPTANGPVSFTVTITSDDPDGDFVFGVSGVVGGFTQADIGWTALGHKRRRLEWTA